MQLFGHELQKARLKWLWLAVLVMRITLEEE